MEHNAYNDFDPNLSSDFPHRENEKSLPSSILQAKIRNKNIQYTWNIKHKQSNNDDAQEFTFWKWKWMNSRGWAGCWAGRRMNYMEIYILEGRISPRMRWWMRRARHVKKFLTWELEACLLSLSLARLRVSLGVPWIFQRPPKSGRCHPKQTATTPMNYGCQFFLRWPKGWEAKEALSLALICRKYFSAHFWGRLFFLWLICFYFFGEVDPWGRPICFVVSSRTPLELFLIRFTDY